MQTQMVEFRFRREGHLSTMLSLRATASRDPLSTECKRRISNRDRGDYRAIKVFETREDIGGKNTRLI